ncbi:pyruvate decarboxylase isozyme 1 [Trichomonascus vanleenenianus]|uniref:alpha-keto acid decarboxylase family protein n=1 Tax=Trichomonascus vanleenenianus TaxID=2268995 RepID=UPI003ECA79D9
MTSATTALATYLFTRLHQLGVKNVLGVPGDFNLLLLDFVEAFDGLNWVGFCNELNAAYAADGYARVKKHPAALVTTFGVGELSALNGISGSHAEYVPIVHIVGTSGRPVAENQIMVHHANPGKNGGGPDHSVYRMASEPFSCAHEYITDPAKAADQIDYVISEVVKQSMPGYIFLPVDMVTKKVDAERLSIELDLEIKNPNAEAENSIVSEILEAIYASKRTSVVVDVLTERHNARELAQELVRKTKSHAFTTPMGKGLIDETDAQFVGLYNGELSRGGVSDAVVGSDLVIDVGPMFSDSNTGGFTRKVESEKNVILHPDYISVRGKTYKGVHFLPVLKKLVAQIDASKVTSAGEKPTIAPLEDVKCDTDISHTDFVKALSKFAQPDDIVLIESGTCQFGSPDVDTKENTRWITQIYYSSIGFTLPAMVGAGIANRELEKQGRVLLVEGDGSAQMTIQELGTAVRQGLTPVVFLLNNSGYSIERAIWGPEQSYNDICPDWQWTKIFEVFGGVEGKTCKHVRVETREELDKVITSEEIKNPDKAILVEVILDKFDYPWRLTEQVRIMSGKNMNLYKKYAAEKGEVCIERTAY